MTWSAGRRKIVPPLGGLGDLLEDGASFVKQRLHVAAEKKCFGKRPEDRQGRGDVEDVLHFGEAGRQRSEEVVMGHGSKGAFDHGVLEVDGRTHGGDFAGEIVPEAEVLCAPGDALAEADEAGGDSLGCDRLFSEVYVSGEVDFYAAGEVEAALNGCIDGGDLFQLDHG